METIRLEIPYVPAVLLATAAALVDEATKCRTEIDPGPELPLEFKKEISAAEGQFRGTATMPTFPDNIDPAPIDETLANVGAAIATPNPFAANPVQDPAAVTNVPPYGTPLAPAPPGLHQTACVRSITL